MTDWNAQVKTIGSGISNSPVLACQHCGGRLPYEGVIYRDFMPYCGEQCAATHTPPPPPAAEKVLQKGDYVLATKYADGDPGDQYVVGFYDGYYDHYGQKRHLVLDSDGKQFRRNGFRRAEPITDAEGRWMIAHFPEFKFLELDEETEKLVGKSVWDWLAECRASTVSGVQSDNST